MVIELHARRLILKSLPDELVVRKMFEDIALAILAALVATPALPSSASARAMPLIWLRSHLCSDPMIASRAG